MSNTYAAIQVSTTRIKAGVSAYPVPKECYNPKLHATKVPMRPGSQDAMKLPSLDHTGNRRPYWANKD